LPTASLPAGFVKDRERIEPFLLIRQSKLAPRRNPVVFEAPGFSTSLRDPR